MARQVEIIAALRSGDERVILVTGDRRITRRRMGTANIRVVIAASPCAR
jgi:hypothetical protein